MVDTIIVFILQTRKLRQFTLGSDHWQVELGFRWWPELFTQTRLPHGHCVQGSVAEMTRMKVERLWAPLIILKIISLALLPASAFRCLQRLLLELQLRLCG